MGVQTAGEAMIAGIAGEALAAGIAGGLVMVQTAGEAMIAGIAGGAMAAGIATGLPIGRATDLPIGAVVLMDPAAGICGVVARQAFGLHFTKIQRGSRMEQKREV